MSQKNKSNIFKDFNTSPFKKELPPKNDSEKTKKELEYLSTIDLDKKFFQDKDDLIGNFFDFLDDEKVKYDKKQLRKIVLDAVDVILELKNHFKRPRPFKLDHDFKDPLVKSTKGYSYPSGHSTQSNLLSLVLSDLYPKYKKDFNKIVDNIVFSRQMAKAHYPSDIKFGEKLAKSMFKYLKDNNLIKSDLKESIRRVLKEESKKIKFSSLFKRKFHIVDRLIDAHIDGMYTCDYAGANEFFEGVIEEMSWMVRSEEFGLDDVDWLDIYDYLNEIKKEEILEYYTERCNDDNV
jgi:hypothetical protein